jgi:hypothetical protein
MSRKKCILGVLLLSLQLSAQDTKPVYQDPAATASQNIVQQPGPTSAISPGNCGTSTGAISLITSANNTLIVTPKGSLSTYKGMAVDAYISTAGTVTLEVCNASSDSITPGAVNFIVRAF